MCNYYFVHLFLFFLFKKLRSKLRFNTAEKARLEDSSRGIIYPKIYMYTIIEKVSLRILLRNLRERVEVSLKSLTN